MAVVPSSNAVARGSNAVQQRLVAAGASPQRAQQFVQQLAAQKTAGKVAGFDLEDLFDQQLDALSKEYFPNVFRPPTVDDPEFDDYASFVLGPKALEKITQAQAKASPNVSVIYQDMVNKGYFKQDGTFDETKFDLLTLPEYAVKRMYLDNDLTKLQLLQEIKAQYKSAIAPEVKPNIKFPQQAIVDIAGVYNEDASINSLINTISDEANALEKAGRETRTALRDSDKLWSANVPSKDLKYANQTNLAKGLVSYRTIPGVKEYFDQETARAKEFFPGSSAAAGYAAETVEKAITQKGLTPYKDEFERRKFVKGKQPK